MLLNSKLPIDVLGRVWELADIDKDGMLDSDEFAVVSCLDFLWLSSHLLPCLLNSWSCIQILTLIYPLVQYWFCSLMDLFSLSVLFSRFRPDVHVGIFPFCFFHKLCVHLHVHKTTFERNHVFPRLATDGLKQEGKLYMLKRYILFPVKYYSINYLLYYL